MFDRGVIGLWLVEFEIGVVTCVLESSRAVELSCSLWVYAFLWVGLFVWLGVSAARSLGYRWNWGSCLAVLQEAFVGELQCAIIAALLGRVDSM